MSKLTFLTVGDVHIADHPPGARIDNYKEATLEKLRMVAQAANKVEADAVLFTGDIFHLKAPSRNSHSMVRALMDVLRSMGVPCYCAPGNHDLRNDRLDSLPHQPLGVLFKSGAMIQLNPEGFLYEVPAKDMRARVVDKRDPYSTSFYVKVACTNYNEKDPVPECHAVKKDGADFLVTVGHFFAGPVGGDYWGNYRAGYPELSETETDIYVLGHFHHDQGIQEVNETHFVNLGSLTRGALDDDNLTRDIKIGLIKMEWHEKERHFERNLSSIRLPVKPPEEIFDLVKHEEIKKEREVMNSFVVELNEEFSRVMAAGGEEMGAMELLSAMELPQNVESELLRRIREAEGI